MNRTPPVKYILRAALVMMPLVVHPGCAPSAHGSTAPSPEETRVTPAAEPQKPAEAAPTAEEARQFTTRVNEDLKRLWTRQSTADWIKLTYITDDTERNAALVNEEVMGYLNQAIKEAARFKDVQGLDADTSRMLHLLRISSSLPAPGEAQKRAELAGIAAKLEGLYGKGKYCGKDGKAPCRDLGELSDVLAKSRNYNELLDAWTGWHSISPPMRPLYQRLVELSNEG